MEPKSREISTIPDLDLMNEQCESSLWCDQVLVKPLSIYRELNRLTGRMVQVSIPVTRTACAPLYVLLIRKKLCVFKIKRSRCLISRKFQGAICKTSMYYKWSVYYITPLWLNACQWSLLQGKDNLLKSWSLRYKFM